MIEQKIGKVIYIKDLKGRELAMSNSGNLNFYALYGPAEKNQPKV